MGQSGDQPYRMTEVERIKRSVSQLSTDELAELRRWFIEYDAERWDEQIENDARAGKLDALAQTAIQQFKAGECRGW
jgi:hypothetical protein